MRYLFFDIECANCFKGKGKICEFGYILTDEAFNETERELFIINPNAEFDWYVAKNLLAYSVATYKSYPDYLHYFDKIKALFTAEDIMVFGHTTESDIKYLNDEAARYSLPYFNCKFYDARYMYDAFAQTPNKSPGVAKICDLLGIDRPQHEHKSVDDAYATMLIVKEVCARMNVSVTELIEKCEDCKGETADGKIKTAIGEKTRIKREELERIYGANIKNNLMRGDNKTNFLRFLDGVKATSQIMQCELTDKKLCISLNYECSHFKEMLALVRLLKNRGCTYTLKATESDYFITYELKDENGEQTPCSRLKYAEEAIASGAAIHIITFSELLKILNVTEQELFDMPFPHSSEFKGRKKPQPNPVRHNESVRTTLGDIFKNKGIDPNNLS